MTTTTTPTVLAPRRTEERVHVPGHVSPQQAVSDAMAITWRNLLTYIRLPQLFVFATIQPTIFVLLFRYVFGGAIKLPPSFPFTYVDYLMPGIFVQTAVFGAMGTGIGLAEDAQKGLIERFRSLPMARSAVLAGRTIADTVRNVFVVILMTVIGVLVGFRIHGGLLKYLVAMALLLLFAYALSWVIAGIGLSVPNAETAQAAVFPFIAPLVFASSAFVDPSTMPGWLQVFAKHQPVTITVDAVRRLVLDQPIEQYALGSILWSVGIVAVFAPLAIRQYRRVA
ncbi:MAG TPA: ABC transporter permease [Acidimicrobiales bacterium]|jgi:ABC-2 type transport system permease protein/oleandomycin transport system permease protein